MPPKRSASGAGGPKAKKSKSASSSAAATPAAPTPEPAAPPKTKAKPKTKRWSAVSASKNADEDFKLAVQDPEVANAFNCYCSRRFIDDGDEDEDDWDDEDEDEMEDEDEEEDDDEPKKAKCDGGKTCICRKPANEYPEHSFVLTYGGFRKWVTMHTMAGVRNPDCFDMYTYNDHEAYGMLECVQNLVLDWMEAETWQEQWHVCEALVLFTLGEGLRFYMIDHAECADATGILIGRLFLTMLARLEAQNLLTEGSVVKNLGLIMSLYIKLPESLRAGSVLEDDQTETLTKPSRFTWKPTRFDDYIHAYANKHGITLYGINDIDELTAELDTNAALPAATGDEAWGWTNAFKTYAKKYPSQPFIGGGKAMVGGDGLDITSWTSATRKKHSFSKKDPFSKKDLDALKEGLVLQML